MFMLRHLAAVRRSCSSNVLPPMLNVGPHGHGSTHVHWPLKKLKSGMTTLHGGWLAMQSGSLLQGQSGLTTTSDPPPTTVHTVTGKDTKGIISRILDAICAQGGTVVSSRSVRMGGLFSQVLLVRDADAAAVDAAVRDVPQVLSAASRPFEHVALGETTARVQFTGTYAKGLASKAISYLCSRDVSVEKLDHRVLTNSDGSSLLVMEGVLRVPSGVRGAELQEDMEKLGLSLRLLRDET